MLVAMVAKRRRVRTVAASWGAALARALRGPPRTDVAAHRRKRGYSLLEILIVLAIIALIATLVGPKLFGQLDKSKTTTAKVQIRGLQAALGTMRLSIGRYPTAQEGLGLLMKADPTAVPGWSGPYLGSALPADPWGRPYLYQPDANPDNPPVILSYGSDGAPGGEGSAADVRSDGGD